MRNILTFVSVFLLLSHQSFAAKKVNKSNYFASMRAMETNVRSGPGTNYPIKFTYKTKAIPVHVINDYDNWSEIEDYEGQSGWISQSLLTKKRTLIVRISKDYTNMYKKSNEKSRVIYRLENNVIGDYVKCIEDWCAIRVNDEKGWVLRSDVFGGDKLN